MKKKKREKKKTILSIIIVVLLILLLALSTILDRKTGRVEIILKDTTSFISKMAMYPFTALNKEKGKTQSESYIIQKNVNSSLEKEIQELKEALELNRSLTEYTPVNATILSRNKSYWFNTITIDKGKKDGIDVDMAVITKNGLIGKITKVSHNSSEVKLITSDDTNYKVSISIKTNEVDNYAIMNGYDKETGLIKATGIDKTTPINQNDIVLTSGLGSMFPGGIYIGTVEKIESDKYNLSKTVYIKTYQNFNDIHYVTVLKVKE
jgi:rod shape-determining protein MreC